MKDLVRLRHQYDKYMLMESQLKSIGLQVLTMQTQIEIDAVLREVTVSRNKKNEAMDIKEIQQVMMQFAKSSKAMGVKMKMMESITEDIAGNVDEEADATYEQILGEVGLELVGGQTVPTTKLKRSVSKNGVIDLEQQLADLRL